MDDFRKLMNAHEGKAAVVLGKGPSLDKYEPIEGPIIIGVNDVGNTIPVDYSVTTDGFKPGVLGKAKLAKLTAIPNRAGFDYNEDEVWFLHCDDTGDGGPSRLAREDVAESRWLYTCSSSAQPAIHLAWYLGCTYLHMFGIDGGRGYAKGMIEHEEKDYNHPDRFTKYINSTLRIANICFGNRWERCSK